MTRQKTPRYAHRLLIGLINILILNQNPLIDFKLLYGSGALRLNDATRSLEQRCAGYVGRIHRSRQ